jgi:hypothetical protein
MPSALVSMEGCVCFVCLGSGVGRVWCGSFATHGAAGKQSRMSGNAAVVSAMSAMPCCTSGSVCASHSSIFRVSWSICFSIVFAKQWWERILMGRSGSAV